MNDNNLVIIKSKKFYILGLVFLGALKKTTEKFLRILCSVTMILAGDFTLNP